MITPAISVLSAVEGLHVATPVFQPFVVPLTLIVLSGLFMLQRRGTAKVGVLFGPIILIWFLTLAHLGWRSGEGALDSLGSQPRLCGGVLRRSPMDGFRGAWRCCCWPLPAPRRFMRIWAFGRKPIRLAWFCIVLPALLLNYSGKACCCCASRSNRQSLLPAGAIRAALPARAAGDHGHGHRLAGGDFRRLSLTRQAVQIGYLPRLTIQHTSDETIGQIYVPAVNMILFIGVLLLVIGFRRSENLAAAYGIAVIGAMAIDTAMLTAVARRVWNWPAAATIILFLFFFVIDITYLSANTLRSSKGLRPAAARQRCLHPHDHMAARPAGTVPQLSAEGLSMSSFLTRLPISPHG
jgi:KUP system potassium uptake protein